MPIYKEQIKEWEEVFPSGKTRFLRIWRFYSQFNETHHILAHGDSECRFGFMVHRTLGDSRGRVPLPESNVRKWKGEYPTLEEAGIAAQNYLGAMQNDLPA